MAAWQIDENATLVDKNQLLNTKESSKSPCLQRRPPKSLLRAKKNTSRTSVGATNQPSARHLSREAKGEPHDVGKLRNALTKRRNRAKKRTQASPAWQAATPEEREEMENAAFAAVMAGQPDFRALGAAAGTRMGRGYGGWKGKGKGKVTGDRGVKGGEAKEVGGEEDKDEDEEMKDLPIDGSDDVPGFWGRRGDDDDEEGGGGAGGFGPAPAGFDYSAIDPALLALTS
ncbi:hypothetical protein EYC80_006774 [Monilinia laxa]|uniref:Uncharacterized protein n=1 Tax=Monilinia laxa TaxID=61186 RepID=A0A5N6JZ68_MONLA|nr:hypothetical protein EYC80_006774 [Monilinia laxa]